MRCKCVLAIGAAMSALALLPASAAVAGGTAPVTVRVEGLKRTLLAPTAFKAHAGSLTSFGAPNGKCPDASAAGALDAATHHRWKGIWESSFNDYEITSILGETHTFSSKDFWEVFVNNVPAQTGACEITVRPGQQIMFAAAPDKGRTPRPLVIQDAPSHATVGRAFGLRVFAVSDKRKYVRVAGAEVSGDGISATTNQFAVATITPTKAGELVLRATHTGYIRSAPLTVHVS
jgi:hypothetical protein